MPDEDNPESREEIVEMHCSRSMRFSEPGEACRNIAVGEKFRARRKDIRWLEASKKGFRDRKRAQGIAEEIAALTVTEIQRTDPAPVQPVA